MADAVLDALASRAGSDTAPEEDHTDPVLKALSARASDTSAPTPAANDSHVAPADSGSAKSYLMRGAGEALAHGASALFALPFAAGNSARELMHNAPGKREQAAAAASSAAQQNAIYQPRTPLGQNMSAVVDYLPQKLGEAGDWAANKITDKTGNAGLGAAADVGVNALPALLGLRGGRGVVGAGTRAAGDAFTSPLAGPRGFPGTPEANAYSRESLGAAAAAPQLENLSPALRAEVERQVSQGGGVSREALTRQVQADQLPVRMQLTEGQATQDPVTISNEMNRRGKDPAFAGRFNEQNSQLAENLDEIRAAEAPTAAGNDHLQNGQSLVDMYKRRDAAERETISGAYKDLTEANGGNFPVDGVAFVDAADVALKKQMKGRYVPDAIKADMEDFRNGEPMTFEHFENLRTNLAAEARKADRSGDGNAAHAVNVVREALESLPMGPESTGLKVIADKARGLAKARFDKIRSDPAYKAVTEDDVPEGNPSPLADDFVQKYIVRGKAANIAKMREHLGGEDEAHGTIAAASLNYLKSKSGINIYTNEGNFSQAGYNRALGELTPKLNHLVSPETAEHLQSLGDVARYTQAQPRGSFVNNSNTFTAAVASHAKGLAETAVNTVVPGAQIGTVVRGKLAARSEARATHEALKPGAGIQLKKLLKPKDK